MANLSEYYQKMFQSLELSQQLENSQRYPEAIQQLTYSCQLIQTILVHETDMQKKQLLRTQLTDFTNKMQKLTLLTSSNKIFEDAIRLDERKGDINTIEKLYLQAAEMYMNYLKLGEDPKIKSRVCQIIGRVEEIKGMSKHTDLNTLDSLPTIDPNAPLKKKTVQATSGSNPGATAPPTGGPTSSSAAAPAPIISPPLPPTSPSHSDITSDSLTPEEINVLRQSSIINGKCLQPWINGEEIREKYNFDTPFCDPDGLLPLSHAQKQHHPVYMRPSEFMNPGQQPVVIRTITPLAVTQDLVADCSFVCSLCIASAFEARHNKRLITSLIYPQNNRGIPIYNPSGKYLVKLFYNGVYRKIVIDDRLPVTENSKRLLCSASRDPTEIWVSLVEKAYMKLNGGYDFPGSNSGIDLHALTGWIPEQVFFEEDSSRPKSGDQNRPADFRQSEDRTWERILSAHRFGDCLITISTGPLTPEEEERTGLVSGHAYAVLNVQSAGILRMLQVRNPWARQTWKGRFSSRDRDRWTPGLLNVLNVKPEDFDRMDDEGIFWIDFADCRSYFKRNPSLFSFRWSTHALWPLSQGPRMDTYFIGANPQYILRVEGRAQGKDSVVSSSIWILLTRHIRVMSEELATESTQTGTFITLHVHKGGKRLYAPAQPYIKGIYSSDPHVLTRIDVSDEDTREANEISLEHPQGKPIEYTLVLSQNDKKRDVNYTLSVYSTSLPFACRLLPPLPLNQLTIQGAWTAETAGGNTNSPTFFRNPQYRLTIHGEKGWDMHIQAMFSKDFNASISVIDPKKNYNSKSSPPPPPPPSNPSDPTQQQQQQQQQQQPIGRIDSIANDAAEIMTSGNYRPGFCYCTTDRLKPGDYVVVISTYETGSIGPFVLTLATNCGAGSLTAPSHIKKYFTVKEIPPEGYGMKRINLIGEWKESDGTAAGCSNFSSYHLNPVYLLTLTAPASLTCRLNIENWTVGSNVGLNISVFEAMTSLEQTPPDEKKEEDGKGNATTASTGTNPPPSFTGRMLPSCTPSSALFSTNNGVYVIRPSGPSLQAISLPAGMFIIVPSTFEPTQRRYLLDLHLLSSLGQEATANGSGYSLTRLR